MVKVKVFHIMISFLDESLNLLSFSNWFGYFKDILNVIILLDFISIQIEFIL
jgi:hypothetical protein